MKFDSYCIALVVLVLFFLYLDNSMNVEGYAPLNGAPVEASNGSPEKAPEAPPQPDVTW